MSTFTTSTPHRPLLRNFQLFILLASVCGMYFLCTLRYPIAGPTVHLGPILEPAHEIMPTLVPRALRGTVLVALDEDVDLPPPTYEAAVEAVVVEEEPEPVAAVDPEPIAAVEPEPEPVVPEPVAEVPVEAVVEEAPPAYNELDPSPPPYTADPPVNAEVAENPEFDRLAEGYGEVSAAADPPVPAEKAPNDVNPGDAQADTDEKSGYDWLFDDFDTKYPSVDDFEANFDAVKEKAREPVPEVKTPLVDDNVDTAWDGKWESDLSDNFDWLFDSSSSSSDKEGTVEDDGGYNLDGYSDAYEDPYGWSWEDYYTYSKAPASETKSTASPTIQRTPAVTRLATDVGQAPKQTVAVRLLDKVDDYTSGAGSKGSLPQMWVVILGGLVATTCWLAVFVNCA